MTDRKWNRMTTERRNADEIRNYSFEGVMLKNKLKRGKMSIKKQQKDNILDKLQMYEKIRASNLCLLCILSKYFFDLFHCFVRQWVFFLVLFDNFATKVFYYELSFCWSALAIYFGY